MKIEKEIGICPVCDKEFEYYPNDPQIYCSRECFYEGNMEFIKTLNKSGQLSEAQLEGLEKGRLNGLNGYKTECNDGHIVQSKIEAEFDNWLYEKDINHNIQVRVCSDRYWTCDFVIFGTNGKTLWIEIDGLGEMREKWGHKENWEEKIKYFEDNDYDFKIITIEDIKDKKQEIEEWAEENIYELIEDDTENKELKEKIKELELKAGAVLNAKNKKDLKDAQVLIQQVLDSASTGEEDSLEIDDEKDIEDDNTVIDLTTDTVDNIVINEPEDEDKIEVDEKVIADCITKQMNYTLGKLNKSDT